MAEYKDTIEGKLDRIIELLEQRAASDAPSRGIADTAAAPALDKPKRGRPPKTAETAAAPESPAPSVAETQSAVATTEDDDLFGDAPTAVTVEVTKDMLRDSLVDYANATNRVPDAKVKGNAAARDIMMKFAGGADQLKKIPAEKYEAVYSAAKAATAKLTSAT